MTPQEQGPEIETEGSCSHLAEYVPSPLYLYSSTLVLKTGAHDDDADQQTLANFASLSKRESHLVNKYSTHLFKSASQPSSSEDHQLSLKDD
jgi:hypothetical protein